jgi:hypothetical protein
MRHMPLRDVVYLIIKPFLGQKQGPTKNEKLSRAVEHGALKDAAAKLTTVPDALLEDAIAADPASGDVVHAAQRGVVD